MVVKLSQTLAAAFFLHQSWVVINVASFDHRYASPSLKRSEARNQFTRCHHSNLSMSINQITWDNPPFLAVLTEPDACVSVQRMDETIHAIERATIDGGVKLVVLRVDDNGDESLYSNKWNLLKRLAQLKEARMAEGSGNFALVVNNDVELVLKAILCNIAVDGVHVKEYNSHLIPSIRQQLHAAIEDVLTEAAMKQQPRDIIIGTSCHSIQSGLDSFNLVPRGPDYLFVGTCYLTKSHPEKTSVDQLEGPSLPGRVRETLHQAFADNNDTTGDGDSANKPPVILAIGGIDEQNCHEPVKFGADGVATIRTVMQADDPREAVKLMNTAMLKIK